MPKNTDFRVPGFRGAPAPAANHLEIFLFTLLAIFLVAAIVHALAPGYRIAWPLFHGAS